MFYIMCVSEIKLVNLPVRQCENSCENVNIARTICLSDQANKQ